MSRSKRLPYIKDRPRNYKKSTSYWRTIRREWSQTIQGWRNGELIFREPKVIINDYDYSDYYFFIEISPQNKRGLWWSNYSGWTKEDVDKTKRK